MAFKINRKSLLSSNARIQVPWVKVTIEGSNGKVTFGVFSKVTRGYIGDRTIINDTETYLREAYLVDYPNYVQSLNIVKINGQVNQYTLNIIYPITVNSDPNLFEKIFSSASKTRKIIFTYGDAATPAYIYKEESAIITTISENFNLEGSSITYTVKAISGAALNTIYCDNFNARTSKPSDVIKELWKTNRGNIRSVFTGMSKNNLDTYIAGNDKVVEIKAKQNISVLDYISYLVSCMYAEEDSDIENPNSIYVLTINDNSMYNYEDDTIQGAYFKVEKVSYNTEKSDAYEVDIGYNTRTIVTNFSIENNENYSILYDYQNQINDNKYVRRLDNKGKWVDVYSPAVSSKNNEYVTSPEDKTWWTKITQFPVNATLTIQGLLRPAQLLTYLRLNIIFPGGVGPDNTRMHIGSGLYIITKQEDNFNSSGYKTTLSLTKVSGALLK